MKWIDPTNGIELIIFPADQFNNDLDRISKKFDCTHAELQNVWHTLKNGSRQLRSECKRCGELVGLALKQDNAAPDTPNHDAEKSKQWDEKRKREVENAKRALFERKPEWDAAWPPV